MNKQILFFLFVISTIHLFGQTSLPNYSGQMLWLIADSIKSDNDSTVYEWIDCSPLHHSVFQSNDTNQAKFADSIINHQSALFFNGNQWFNGNNICNISSDGMTIFVVGKSSQSNGTFIAKSLAGGTEKRYALFYSNNKLNYLFHSNTVRNITIDWPIDSFNIYTTCTDFAKLKNKLSINGLLKDSVDITDYDMNSDYDFLIGTYNNNHGDDNPPASDLFLNGYISEIIIYNRPLTFNEKYHVENYLRYKYFPDTYQTPVSLGYDIHIPYGFCDTTLNAGARFTNYLWSTGDTTQTISVKKSGQYAVTVTDIFGFQSSDTISVYFPEVHQLTDTTICPYDTIFWNSGLDSSYHFSWSTGDSLPQIYITQENSYALTVTDSLGCQFFTDTAFVTIDSFPHTTTLGNDTTLCKGSPLMLKTGQASAIHYFWSTGDTTSSITINTSGNYSLKVVDTLSCIAYDTIHVTVHGQSPIADFSWANICLGDTTKFTDASYTLDGSHIVSWQWQLDDTITDSLQNPTYQYPYSDTISIKLHILTDSNCTNDASKTLIIHPLPHADFSFTNPCHKQSVLFSNTSTSVDSLTFFQWIVNDTDIVSNNANLSYWFDTTKTYPVDLEVKTNFGCTDHLTQNIEVKESPNTQFSYSLPCENTPVQFFDNTTITPTFSIISWHWNFGDGTSSNEKSPTHTYLNHGNDTIILEAMSVNGCSAFDTQLITINPRPEIAIEVPHLCSQTNLLFTNQSSIDSSDSIVSYKWYINQSEQSDLTNPYFIFPDSGSYRLSLIAISSHACADTLDTLIAVAPRPNASFSYSPSYPTPNETITFTCDTAFNYFWLFNQTSSANSQTATFSNPDTGNFPAQLIVENSFQCYDTTQQSIHVVPAYYDLVLYDFTVTQNQSYVLFNATVLNASPRAIYGFDFILSIQGSPPLKEHISDTLWPNTIKHYQLSTQYNISTIGTPNFFCLSANLLNATDIDTTNNTLCRSLDDNFTLFTPYPNPSANHKVMIRFVLPKDETCTLKLFNRTGQLCWQKEINGVYGLNSFLLDMSSFNAGSYTLTAQYLNLLQKQQIIKK